MPSVDISTFTRQTGHTTLDYGFVNTSATKSAITFIDGDQGILRYRGYPIEQLAQNSTYLEVAWLLIYGNLPSRDELAEFDERIRHHTLLHEDLKRFFSSLPSTAHPMSVLSSATAALSTYYENESDPNNPEHVELNTIRMLAKLPVIAAYAHKKSIGQAFLYPDNSLELRRQLPEAQLRRAVRAVRDQPGHVARARAAADPARGPRAERVDLDGAPRRLDRARTSSRRSRPASTPSTARCTAARTRPCSTCSARIRESGESVQRFVERVKNKEDGVKLMGFGHRVYKNYDPRAKLVKESADEVLEALGVSDPLLDLAKELEAIALADDYFKERRLYPNVDFYTGVIYKAMGFPTRMFTVLFAIGRLPGWLAHWREMQADPQTKIGRPQQLYAGAQQRDYPGVA